MNSKSTAVMIVASSGLAALSSGAMGQGDAGTHRGIVRTQGHIYYNLITGERIVTTLGDGQTSPADTGTTQSIWSSNVEAVCADANGGFQTQYFFSIWDPDSTTYAAASALLDHGDIATDTVVDCFRINWVVEHPDTDTDFDSIGDGVAGLAGEWAIWDADNGRAENRSTRLPLIVLRFDDLPGNVAGPGFLSGYTLDVDLSGASGSSDLTFEIGDSDGDCQVASFCNSDVDYGDGTSGPIALGDRDGDGMLDSDLDGDGLFDWSWSVRFFQPGTIDTDGDGVIDGVPAPSGSDVVGIAFGAPDGSAVDNGDGTWAWNIDTTGADAGTGQEDHAAIYEPIGPGGALVHTTDMGGNFSCDGVPISQGGNGYTPPAMFSFQLFGGGCDLCCPVDLNGDGQVNFFDVSLFIQAYNAGADYNGDGETNFFDVSHFIQDFNAGCP
jgi:hypothetical protein